jgi:hypothetical protein
MAPLARFRVLGFVAIVSGRYFAFVGKTMGTTPGEPGITGEIFAGSVLFQAKTLSA